MNDGANITIVHEGRCRRATVVNIPGVGWHWWQFTFLADAKSEGRLRLGDKDIRWVRGWLWRWWPPDRRRMRALEVADALAGPPQEEKPRAVPPTAAAQVAINSANQMIANFNLDIANVMRDANKMIADANKMVRGAARTTTWRVRITKRR